MNNKHFFISLAIMNIKKNGKFYLPYLMTFIGTVAMYYMIHAISLNQHIPGGNNMCQMMSFGTYVIGIFAIVFLFYTNSFLIKRRKPEFGLYHILGMEKKHIAKVLLCESLLISAAGIAGGLIIGILFQKLLLMLLLRIARFSDVPISFEVELASLASSILLFGVVFVITFASNAIQLARTKTVELLQGDRIGEREPKTKWAIALLGAVAIGAGYVIALTVKNPLEALSNFFFAVLLVIIGTYFLFMAGSIVVLKALRRNHRFYYKTNHFTAVSGLLYRMKQNAAGLASICILSTMVLVTLSTTVCLYVGVEDAIKTRYPHDISVMNEDITVDWDSTELQQRVLKSIENYCKVVDYKGYKSLAFVANYENGDFTFEGSNYISSTQHGMLVLTAEEYNKISGESIDLSGNEICVYDMGMKAPDKFHIFSKEYRVKKYLKSLDEISVETSAIANLHCIIVADNSVMTQIFNEEKSVYKETANTIQWQLDIDVEGAVKQQIQAVDKVSQLKGISYAEGREANRENFYATYGSFLFLGLFLGTIFIMATTLIIYYKQISEGYDDKKRFEIMQKVGMSKREVKASIRSQVILVFFLPLVTAVLHVCVAFPMIKKLLKVLNMSNPKPFLWCLMGTIIIFAVVYILLYSLTSKVYYKIVE